jgi:aminoglycoside N3'-acetyltransferase
MKTYALSDVESALKACGIAPGDVIFVHSSLFSLGRMTEADPVGRLVNGFVQYLGPKGTLGVPTFNFDFCSGQAYNRQETPSKMMGAFNEAVRLDVRSRRSPHPLQSTAFIGPLAGELTAQDPASGYGPGSPFALLLAMNAKLVLFGCGFTAASFIHYVEESCQVPYRYWKEFSGSYTDQGMTRQATYKMYVRRLDMNTEFNLEQIEGWLFEAGQLRKAPVGGEFIRVCRFKDYFATVQARILKNPMVLLRHPAQT